jgi:hypothetical protein
LLSCTKRGPSSTTNERPPSATSKSNSIRKTQHEHTPPTHPTNTPHQIAAHLGNKRRREWNGGIENRAIVYCAIHSLEMSIQQRAPKSPIMRKCRSSIASHGYFNTTDPQVHTRRHLSIHCHRILVVSLDGCKSQTSDTFQTLVALDFAAFVASDFACLLTPFRYPICCTSLRHLFLNITSCDA